MPPHQKGLLEPLAHPVNSKPEDEPGVKAFTLIKSLTIFGYYTSQIGLDEELKYEGDRLNPLFPGVCSHPEHQARSASAVYKNQNFCFAN